MTALRIFETVHGHLAILAMIALVHPAILLRRGLPLSRGATWSVALTTAVTVAAFTTGLSIYGRYREVVKPELVATHLGTALLFETKEHLAWAVVSMAVGAGLAALLAPRGAHGVRRAAALAYARRRASVPFHGGPRNLCGFRTELPDGLPMMSCPNAPCASRVAADGDRRRAMDRVRQIICLVASVLVSAPVSAQEEPDAPVVVPPRIASFVEAEYPTAAREAGLEATVDLELVVDSDGTVSEATVVGPAGHGFDDAALAAARLFRFEPATRDGRPIAARIRYRYVFELREEVRQRPPGAVEEQARPGRLQGRVLASEDDGPVREAEVLLSSEDASVNRRAVTGRNGGFIFDALPPGRYRITILANEYGDYETMERIEPGESADVVYRMAPAVDPNAFSATARIEPPPREIVRRTITREELTRIPGTRGDALRTVELLPGVGRPRFGAGQLIVRGSAPTDSQVFLDGAPVPLLYHFGGLTSFFNSRLLDRIDFFPGNFSVRYGRKMGGILEVASRDPAHDAFHGVLDVNLIDASLLVEAPIGDNVSVALAGRRSYIDFFFQNVIPDDAFDVIAAPVYYDYQALLTWRPSDRDRIRLVGYGSSDDLALVFSEPAGADPNVRGNFGLSTQFHHGYLGWTHALTPNVDQDIQIAVGPTLVRFEAGDAFRFDGTFTAIDARSEWRARVTDRVRLTGGLDLDVTPFSLEYVGPSVGQAEGGGPGSGNALSQSRQPPITSSGVSVRPAGYVETDLRPSDAVQIVTGLRLDYYDDIMQWSFDPRIVSVLSLDDANRVKLGVGVFSQPPEAVESSEQLGEPNLDPIHALHFGAGYERDVADGVTVGVEGFYKYLWDRVVAGPPTGPRFTNDGVGRIYGLEVSGRVSPAGRRWFGFLSYTLIRSERLDGPDQRWRLFDSDQTHILSLALVYRLGRGWEVGGTFRLVSGNPTTPIDEGRFDASRPGYLPVSGAINSERNPFFHRLDLRVEKLFEIGSFMRLAIYLDIQNVYNSTNPEGTIYDYRYRESTEIPGLPIIPSLGVRGEI